MFGAKLVLWLALGAGISYGASYYANHGVEGRNATHFKQFEDDDAVPEKIRDEHMNRAYIYSGAVCGWLVLGVMLFWSDGRKRTLILLPFLLATPGCAYKPFEPIKWETVGTSEEGFLIPLRGDKTKQASTNSEADLRANIVSTKQVQVPQQWHSLGYETTVWNGRWEDAAVLIKVDRSPVTREWTADTNSGTSNRNEAVWVMTSDQVEFSTGWTITARIPNKDEAIKFLHNYPNGALKDVLDKEVRAKLQATFGIEVTDLPMEELRKAATPHIENTKKTVIDFFRPRGIEITNLGITGGFVYKDKSIQDTMVAIFNAEQEKTKAAASTAAQEEKNKKIRMEAEGKAVALLLEKKAEADGIKAVADAKAYEIQKAQENKDIYLALKRIELDMKRQERWDGKLPTSFIGGGENKTPDTLLTVPAFGPK